MKLTNKLKQISLLLAIIALSITTAFGAKPYKVLIVTGQSNHNWSLSSKVLRDITDSSPLFTSEIYKFPKKGEGPVVNKPKFKKYDAIVMVYTGESWSEEIKSDFEKYITKGGAMLAYHEGDNAFPEWTAFNEMIGLGGWGKRDENSGPYVYWKDGEFIEDNSAGKGGAHGKQSEYVVTTRDAEHPIMRGLPTEWMHKQDELYGNLRGPAKNMNILATAYSDKETRGTGKEEPVLWTVDYGKGKIFHTVMGHVKGYPLPSMECVGFQVTYLRGLEWIITGDVTQAVPSDFPTATTSSKRELKVYQE